jgi:nucleoside-diphosphate-sugar epimerase
VELDKLLKQKILVTGGSGFAGRHAIRRLIEDGYTVVALVRNKEKLQKAIGENFESSLLNTVEIEKPEKETVGRLRQLIEENDITTIIHIASIVGEHKISWEKYFEVNVFWTRNLALAFLSANVYHDKFIFTSSVGVYGTIPKRVPADEDTSVNPDGSYHKSKTRAEDELLGLQSSSNLPLIILRPTILYGNEDKGFLFKLFKLMAKKIFPLSNNNPCVHLLDVELLADVYAKFIELDHRPTRCIFNVGDFRPLRMRELAEYITKSMDAGYLKVPSLLFAFLTKLSAFNGRYSVSLKLLSRSWFYNVDKLYETINLRTMDTVQCLDKKYIAWYKGV